MLRSALLSVLLAACGTKAPPPVVGNPALLDPTLAHETAPAAFAVEFDTTQGKFVVDVHRDWAPNGADRLYNLVKIGFYEDVAFYRAVEGFAGQFGISGVPAISAAWATATIPDDPRTHTNAKATMAFAAGGPNSRTTQLFVNFVDNPKLDDLGLVPFGEIRQGLEVVTAFYTGYGVGFPNDPSPTQPRLTREGNDYLKRDFPKLDYIRSAKLLP